MSLGVEVLRVLHRAVLAPLFPRPGSIFNGSAPDVALKKPKHVMNIISKRVEYGKEMSNARKHTEGGGLSRLYGSLP